MNDLRTIIEHLLKEYNPNDKEKSKISKQYIEKEAPKIIESTGLTSGYLLKGSTGIGNHSLCPWIAIMDERITKTVREGFYVVYIKSSNPNCVYLVLGQGCTQVKKDHGTKKAKRLLLDNSKMMLEYISNYYGFNKGMFEFKEWGADSQLYPYGSVLYASYKLDNLPSNETMIDDLSKMLKIYSEIADKYDEIKKNLNGEHSESTEISEGYEKPDFVKMLQNKKLFYSTSIIEFFMLSLKAKQFVILSGGSGTGKTKIAQIYGEYLNSLFDQFSNSKKVTVTLGKSDENGGYTLGKKLYGDNNPLTKSKEYPIRIGNLDTTAEIELTPRLWFRQNKSIISNEIKRLKEEGKKETEILIYDPSFQNGSHFELIPVGSNWTESRFIVGYYNVLKNEYNDTQASKLIKRSNVFSDEPFILILDEMNLSHVERYFSDVLSSMESGVPIAIDNPKETQHLIVGDNLFIVGTVNIDETTYSFSPKVLDRANVIEFESVSVNDYIESDNKYASFRGNTDYLFDCKSGLEVRKLNSKTIVSKLNEIDNESITKMIEDLEKIRTILDNINLPFGFRTIDEIMRFMYVSYEYMGFKKFDNWNVYFDAQIKQKILPKIHGNMSIMESLQELQTICKGDDSTGEALYRSSYNKLNHMIAILKNQRYVTFNS